MSTGADVLVENLVQQGVERIFTVPGAKIDRVLEAVRISGKIDLVVCRNEQNAAFMAAGHGRRTGKAGVVLATSGPGITNLATGLVTATCEGDPVVAFGGAVPLSMRLKRTHQSMDNVGLLKPVTKFAVEIDSRLAIAEVTANAFRYAEGWGRPGASFVSLPMDVMMDCCEPMVLTPVAPPPLGIGDEASLSKAAALINAAERPLILSGCLASEAKATAALRVLLATHPVPVVSTFQGTGTVPKELQYLYCGRVGIVRNQPGDALLHEADVVIAVGYDVIEYDAGLWNKGGAQKKIIHIDQLPFDSDNDYMPTVEILGSISANLLALTSKLSLDQSISIEKHPYLMAAKQAHEEFLTSKPVSNMPGTVHPLQIVRDMQKLLNEPDGDRVTYYVDMGSFHIWIARYLIVHRPRQLVITNGQQTLGVALPWAMSAAFDARKRGSEGQEVIISVSGDGGFLFSSSELETAVRFNLNIVHIVFDDSCYNMVKIQQELKYHNSCAVDLGEVDFVKHAESFGAKGFLVNSAADVLPTIKKAIEMDGPVVIAIPVDYSQNKDLFAQAHDRFH